MLDAKYDNLYSTVTYNRNDMNDITTTIASLPMQNHDYYSVSATNVNNSSEHPKNENNASGRYLFRSHYKSKVKAK